MMLGLPKAGPGGGSAAVLAEDSESDHHDATYFPTSDMASTRDQRAIAAMPAALDYTAHDRDRSRNFIPTIDNRPEEGPSTGSYPHFCQWPGSWPGRWRP